MTLKLFEAQSKRRDKLVIMAEILSIAKPGVSKTSIMYRANLSFSQLNQYLTAMLQSQLLEKSVNNGKIVYCPTEKGLTFLELQQQIMDMLSEKNLSNMKTPPFEYSALKRRQLVIH